MKSESRTNDQLATDREACRNEAGFVRPRHFDFRAAKDFVSQHVVGAGSNGNSVYVRICLRFILRALLLAGRAP